MLGQAGAALADRRHFRYIHALVTPNEARARSSAGEHYVDIVGVTGSIPVAPTSFFNNLIQTIPFGAIKGPPLGSDRRQPGAPRCATR